VEAVAMEMEGVLMGAANACQASKQMTIAVSEVYLNFRKSYP